MTLPMLAVVALIVLDIVLLFGVIVAWLVGTDLANRFHLHTLWTGERLAEIKASVDAVNAKLGDLIAATGAIAFSPARIDVQRIHDHEPASSRHEQTQVGLGPERRTT